MSTTIRVGISTCLLGEPVRYDGQHKRDAFLCQTLGKYVEYVPVCPEVECGLGVPREAMRLVGDSEQPRLVTIRSGTDLTARMHSWAAQRVIELEQENLCGFIFKSNSPSSGMERVKVYNDKGVATRNGIGMFARAFMQHFPLLPVEEEGRLHDPQLREDFIARIFAMHRWKSDVIAAPSAQTLQTFHARHKLQLMAHSPEHYRQLGRMLGHKLSAEQLPATVAAYEQGFFAAIARRATPTKNLNVLQHVMGYFRRQLSSDEKQELLQIFAEYRAGDLPLIVPITLLNHYVRKYEQPYLAEQVYLQNGPAEMHLRNHA